MADDTTAPEVSAAEDMIPKSEVEAKIKERLKKHLDEKDQLAQQVESLQNQLAQAPMPAPTPTPPEPSAPLPDQNTPSPGIPQTAAPSSLTVDQLREEMQRQQNVQNQAAAHNQMLSSVNEFSNQDPEFKKLINDGNGLKIPQEVAVHLTNSLDKTSAHKTMKRLLTSKLDNANMQANLYKGIASGNFDEYNNWLQGLLKDNTAPPQGKDPVDLSGMDSGDMSSSFNVEDALDDFAKNG